MILDNNNPITRRRFLLSVAASVIVGCTDPGRDAASVSSQQTDYIRAAMPGLTGDREAAARIGRSYLDAHPEYQTGDALLNVIERALSQLDPDVAKSTDNKRIVVLVKKLVASEYQLNKVEKVAGWILSITEVRLYALVALEVSPKIARSPVSTS